MLDTLPTIDKLRNDELLLQRTITRSFGGIPVYVNPSLSKTVIREKVWRRRGIGRLPKRKFKHIELPVIYYFPIGRSSPMHGMSQEGRECIWVNPKMVEKIKRMSAHVEWLKQQQWKSLLAQHAMIL